MTPQQTIAHYRVTGKLGEGGMGEVYRATDTKLGREVAIKVIPDSFALDPDRMARFKREAQTLASLNHPNIAAIYGVEENAIVMELVEGEELHGPMPVEDALPLIEQLIDALEYAHEKGVVHRDLKPANIKITPEGRLKVLDFGLAKALANDGPAGNPVSSPTLTMRATLAGSIMGTAAYMAPEQARGQAVDRRADIWAFGVVLFEMLTGTQLFAGTTVSDTLAAVLRQEVDFSAIPPRFVKLLTLCLARDPKRRLREIGDARFLMDEPSTPKAAGLAPVSRSGLKRWIAPAIALAALLASGALWRGRQPANTTFFQVDADLGPAAMAGLYGSVAVSPDGSRIAYPSRLVNGIQGLAVRELNRSTGTPLLGTEQATLPFFSPDSQWVGFFAAGKLKKISISGGIPLILCDAPNGRGAHWGDDGSIVATLSNTVGISRIPGDGGTPRLLTKPGEKGELSHRWPQMLPGSQALLFSANITATDWDQANVEVLSLKTGQSKTLIRGGYFGRYLPSGHLIYLYQGALYGAPFDPVRLEVKGRAVELLPDVAASTPGGGGQFDFSQTGTLAYLRGKAAVGRFRFGWMPAAGKLEELKVVPAAYSDPHLSPDDKQLAIPVTNTGEVWLFDLERGTSAPLSRAAHGCRSPVWTPDGRHIAYVCNSGNNTAYWWARTDGVGSPVLFSEGPGYEWVDSISPDGRYLTVSTPFGEEGIRIVALDLSDPDRPKAGEPQRITQTGARATFSPDGRWLAYQSAESGTQEIYVKPAPGQTGSSPNRWRISASGGKFPVWSRAGGKLFYSNLENYVMLASYTTNRDAFLAGTPQRWSENPIGNASGSRNFDVSLDGKRVLACTPTEQEALKGNLHLTFLFNFGDEVRRRIP